MVLSRARSEGGSTPRGCGRRTIPPPTLEIRCRSGRTLEAAIQPASATTSARVTALAACFELRLATQEVDSALCLEHVEVERGRGERGGCCRSRALARQPLKPRCLAGRDARCRGHLIELNHAGISDGDEQRTKVVPWSDKGDSLHPHRSERITPRHRRPPEERREQRVPAPPDPPSVCREHGEGAQHWAAAEFRPVQQGEPLQLDATSGPRRATGPPVGRRPREPSGRPSGFGWQDRAATPSRLLSAQAPARPSGG